MTPALHRNKNNFSGNNSVTETAFPGRRSDRILVVDQKGTSMKTHLSIHDRSYLWQLAMLAAFAVLTTTAAAQTYTVTDLGPVGGPPGQPYFIANNGLVSGAAAVNTARHAVLWYKGLKMDIGAHGLGGPNSTAFGVNERGQAVGQAQTSVPNNEDFCGSNAYGLSPSATTCLPFLWQYGVMTRLPTLGGANGVANMINNRGEAVGYAENNTQDPGCPVHQFEPVVWENGTIRKLPTHTGDAYGVAAQINDNGQVAGASGACGPPALRQSGPA
jgi:uncharacterized membrane protein